MSDEVFYCDEMYMDDLLYDACCMKLDEERQSAYEICHYDTIGKCPFGGPFDNEGNM